MNVKVTIFYPRSGETSIGYKTLREAFAHVNRIVKEFREDGCYTYASVDTAREMVTYTIKEVGARQQHTVLTITVCPVRLDMVGVDLETQEREPRHSPSDFDRMDALDGSWKGVL